MLLAACLLSRDRGAEVGRPKAMRGRRQVVVPSEVSSRREVPDLGQQFCLCHRELLLVVIGSYRIGPRAACATRGVT